MDYDLVRMGSTNFEQMAVALCGAEFGSGGDSFGRGPDGGREWTYAGSLPLPYESGTEESWTGYSVAQAKHKSPGGMKDVPWLLRQIQLEVNDWMDEDSNRVQKPDNLLIITNVDLSGIPQRGGIDQVTEKMKSHAKTLGLKGWKVWHAAHISRLLDNHPGVRQTYLGLVTTGDLIATLTNHYSTQQADDFATLQNFVAKELVSQANVRLTRAGDGPESEKISDIGIDLPARRVFQDIQSDDVFSVGQSLIQAGNHVLKNNIEDNSSVIVGGPGQGKSTITQMICQAYRLALLKGSISGQSRQTQQNMLALETHFSTIGFSLPTMHRWPIYLRLNQYSQELAGARDISILRYIAQLVSERTSTDITAHQLHSWLAKWPWVVVLDGLDEVPDPMTRTNLLDKISDFMTDIAQAKADVYILATTREQGYERDLEMLGQGEYKLISLEKPQALSYAAKLVAARFPEDEDTASDVLKRLTVSAEDAATAALLNTPLQVSIMTSLLRDQVKAPTTRHELFESYYDTVLRRESNKEGRLGEKMTGLSAEISAIHNVVGARLQSDSESAGKADIHVTKAELEAMAAKYFEEVQTYSATEALTKASDIVSLATHRLVLLVEASPDRWGYEIRSFQEFTASRYLLDAPEELIITRLSELAPSAHWRNVWLFAVGRLFKERPHLRNDVVGIVRDLDSRDLANQMTLPGARLAADMLIYGVASSLPQFRDKLLNEAIRVLGRYGVRFDLFDVLNRATKENLVLTTSVKDIFRANLGLGGSIRVRSIATMRMWADTFTGPIPAFCRQILPSLEAAERSSGLAPTADDFVETVITSLSHHFVTVEQQLASADGFEELDEDEAALLREFKDGLRAAAVTDGDGGRLVLLGPPTLSASLLEKINESPAMLRIADIARISSGNEVLVSDVISMEFLQLVNHRAIDRSGLDFSF